MLYLSLFSSRAQQTHGHRHNKMVQYPLDSPLSKPQLIFFQCLFIELPRRGIGIVIAFQELFGTVFQIFFVFLSSLYGSI